MTFGTRAYLVIASFAALLAAGVAAPREPMLDMPAPDFQVTTINGKTLTLADFRGRVLVLNFWATWCGPCKKELPLLDGYYRARQSVGLRVLAVTTEDSLSPRQLKPLAAVLAIPMVRRFKGKYGPLNGVPTNYVIDRNDILRYAKAGALTLDGMNLIFAPLLDEHEAGVPAPESPDKGLASKATTGS